MKKIILISSLISFIGVHKITAQTYNSSPDTCNYLGQFSGEWRYTNGADTVRIFLRPHRFLIEAVTINLLDRLWGWHEYKNGNTVTQSNYQNRFMPLPFNAINETFVFNSIILGLPDCADTSHRLIGLIKDSYHPTSTFRVVAVLDATKTIMTWWQTRSFGSFQNPDTAMTLPQQFTLYKQ